MLMLLALVVVFAGVPCFSVANHSRISITNSNLAM
jgi:hypothetical protein